MKKVLFMFAAVLMAASASAQTATTANKFGDNWYVGINGGLDFTNTVEGDNATAFKGMAPNFGIRIGKNLTTVFGLALEGNALFKLFDGLPLTGKFKGHIASHHIRLCGFSQLRNPALAFP